MSDNGELVELGLILGVPLSILTALVIVCIWLVLVVHNDKDTFMLPAVWIRWIVVIATAGGLALLCRSIYSALNATKLDRKLDNWAAQNIEAANKEVIRVKKSLAIKYAGLANADTYTLERDFKAPTLRYVLNDGQGEVQPVEAVQQA